IVSSVGKRNLLIGSDLKEQYIGNSFTVNGKTYNTYVSGYAYYNGGISNPTTNYHSYIDNDTFGFPVVAYNESNGSRNWKGSSIDVTNQVKETGNGIYSVSFNVYATGAGTKIYGGFYYHHKSTGVRSFHSGQYNININNVNEWHRVSGTCHLNDDVDWNRPISFYFYGS